MPDEQASMILISKIVLHNIIYVDDNGLLGQIVAHGQ
jgi:hypothetical protein